MATFDSLASTYDTEFTHSAIGAHLRNRVHQRLLELWHTGDHVLELGCGTGEDAHFLGSHNIQVTATDASPHMCRIATRKNQHINHVAVHALDLNVLLDHQFNDVYDGVLSNFGALNCIASWDTLAQWLAQRVREGGTLTFVIMAPFCIWETLWHGAHLDIKTATRRWRNNTTFELNGQATIQIYYPTIKQLTDAFMPYFVRTHVQPLGLFLPPSDVYPVIEKRLKILNWLTRADDYFAKISYLSLFADHYWIEFRRI